MKALLFILLSSFLLFSSSSFHPIYVSSTEVDYKAKDKKIEIAIKIFSDDLQEAITKEKQKHVEIGTDREHKDATQFIIDYLKTNFKFKVNGKMVDYNFVHRKLVKKDFFAMWIILEINKVKKVKSLELFNNILIPLHSTQQNIVTFRYNDSPFKKFTTYKGSENITLY